jgi:hypothetical protein
MATVTNTSPESVDCPLLGVGALAPGASVEVSDALVADLPDCFRVESVVEAEPSPTEGNAPDGSEV